VEILTSQRVIGLESNGPSKKLKLQDGNELLCRSVLIASGVSYRKLEAKGIEQLTGAGVYYGASMGEGENVTGKDISIVGGANSAGQAAMYFSRFLINQIQATPNIKILTKTEIKEVIGTSRLECLKITQKDNPDDETIAANALFIFIGARPHTDWLSDKIARDSYGFILSGSDIGNNGQTISDLTTNRPPHMLETSLPGVFVAGDVRHGSVKRVASAVGEGSMAVMFVHRYLSTV
jgi:thioredoxin reductase (NADPH)